MVGDGIGAAARRRSVRGLLGLLAVLGVSFLLSACEAPPACTHRWVGPANGDFGVAGHWDAGTVPGATDVACAPAASSIRIGDPRTVRRVALNNSTLHVTPTGSLTTTAASNATHLTIEGAVVGEVYAAFVEVGGTATLSGNSVVAGASEVTVSGAPRLHGRARLWSNTRLILDHATIHVCDDASVRIEGTDTSTASSITTMGCAAVGSASIQATGNWRHDGDLTSDLPIIARGCSTDLRGALTAPSYRQVEGVVCSAPMATVVSPSSVLTFGVLHLDTGRLTGTGTVKADVEGAGTVAPGTGAPGATLTIDGDYTPSAGAHLAIDVRFHAVRATDVLHVTGTATLTHTTISVSLAQHDGTAVIGVSYKPLLFGARVGSIAGVEKPPGSIPSWAPSYVADGAVLTTDKGVPELTWPAPGAILAGEPLGATQLNATSSAAGTFVYSPAPGTVLPAGSNRTLSVTFHPTDTATFVAASTSVLINVTATAPTVTWSNPAAIVKWTPLGASQLNATASVPGSFFYSPGRGAVLDVGAARPLSVLFVPTDRATYPTVTKTVTIAVTAPPTLNTFRTQVDTPGRADAPLVVDLDGDGRADVAGTHGGGSELSVLLRTTASGFAPRVTYNVGTFPRRAEAGDLNGDGRLDLVVEHNDNAVSVLLGTGGGAFGPAVRVPVGGVPNGMAVGDLNSDGRSDVALGMGASVKVLWGDGTGALGSSTVLPIPGISLGAVRVADLDADGRLDIVGRGNGRAAVLMNQGTGAFAAPAQFVVPGTLGRLTVGDVTGDAKPDLVMSAEDGISVHPGVGNGTFSPSVGYAAAFATGAPSIGDLDGDGRVDVAITASGAFLVFRGLPAGTLAAPVSYPFRTASTPGWGAIGDVDGDHRPDLVAASGAYSSDPGTLSVLLGATASSLTWAAPAPIGAGTALGPTQLNAVASVAGTIAYSPPSGTVLPTGESVLTATVTPTDIATYAPATASVKIVVTGAGGFSGRAEIASGKPTRSMLTQDIDGDGDLDLLSTQWSPTAVAVRLGTGAGTFGVPTLYNLASGARTMALADLNKDSQLDLVVTTLDETVIMLGTGGGSFGAGTSRYFRGDEVSIADINGDAKLDLVLADYFNAKLHVLFGNGTGGTTVTATHPTGSYPWHLAAQDLNGDGRADVVLFSHTSYSVYPGTPSGLGAKVDYAVGGFVTGSALADATGDGKPDLISVTDAGASLVVSVAAGTGVGTFDWGHRTSSVIGNATTPTNPYDEIRVVVAADRNRDGKVDLTFLNDPAGTVGVTFGSGAGTFGPAGSYAALSSSRSLVVGDFDGDLEIDAAVGYEDHASISVFTGT